MEKYLCSKHDTTEEWSGGCNPDSCFEESADLKAQSKEIQNINYNSK